MERPEIRLLLTSTGGLVVPGMIRSLRNEPGYSFYIVSLDAKSDAVGFHYADKSYVVPRGDHPDYFKAIYSISKKEKVDVILPLSDEEMIAISRNQKKLKSIGTIPLCSTPEAVETASDKGKMLAYLKRCGFRVPEFCLVSSLKDLNKAVDMLGYPGKDIILKPCVGRGARGFWRLSTNADAVDLLWHDRSRQKISYKYFYSLAKDASMMPRLVAMECLDGFDYNIDLLTFKGKTLAICPMRRLVPDAGPIQAGCIVKDKLLETEVRSIVKKFNFSYNINIEMAYRNSKKNNPPLVYEINPRASAAVAISAKVGRNLLLAGILMALKEKVPPGHFKRLYFQRFYEEVYYS